MTKENKKKPDPITETADTRANFKKWTEIGSNADKWEITLFPVARKSKQTKKDGVKCVETYAPFVLSVTGNKEKHPLADFEFLDIPNGKREVMILWACDFANSHGLRVREWIANEHNSARDKIIKGLVKANERANKILLDGVEVFKEKATDRAGKTFDKIPERIEERNAEIERLRK